MAGTTGDRRAGDDSANGTGDGVGNRFLAGDHLVAVVLAAGEGRRLRPLSDLVPKPLCPVANRPLLDDALARASAVTGAVAVNVHHGREALLEHLRSRPDVHVSIEAPDPLGTAGALGQLRPWIDGRGVLVQNADGWSVADLTSFVDGWDGERPRLLVAAGPVVLEAAPPGAPEVPFGPGVGLMASLLPWSDVAALAAEPSGLFEVVWRDAAAAGRLDVVTHPGPFVDAGSPRRYLEANLAALGQAESVDPAAIDERGSLIHPTARVSAGVDVRASVVGAGATVAGDVERSVVWPGAEVGQGEQLVEAIRAPGLTVVVCEG